MVSVSKISTVLIVIVASAAEYFSDDVYEEFRDIVNYAKVSYCSGDRKFGTGKLGKSCPKMKFCDENADDIEIINTVKPSLINKEISGDAFVALKKESKQVYVAFRGTNSAGDCITDVNSFYCSYSSILNNDIDVDFHASTKYDENAQFMSKLEQYDQVCENCRVHCGVYLAMNKFLHEIDDTIRPFIQEGYQLYVTGHSLGGGYATLAGLEFLEQGYNPIVVTFGSMKISNLELSQYIDKMFETVANSNLISQGAPLPVPSLSRVYQKDDLIPLQPVIPKYYHSGLVFQINKLALPHDKVDIEFKPHSSSLEHVVAAANYTANTVWLYAHTHLFVRLSWPCNDWTF